jgi:DNA-binding transcriptional MerR regulator
MQVRELARLAKVPPHVVRYYTQRGLLCPARNPNNQYRNYADSDISRIRFIRRAGWLGFSLRDIETILHDADHGLSPCPKVRRIIEHRLEQARERLRGLNRLLSCMTDATSAWERLPDRPPDHESLCLLIDSIGNADGLDLNATYRL